MAISANDVGSVGGSRLFRTAILVLLLVAPFLPSSAASEPTRLVLHAEGSAGQWIIARYTFPSTVGMVPLQGTFRFAVEPPAEGPPRAFVQRPSATHVFAGGSAFPEGADAPQLITGEEGEPLVVHLASGGSVSGTDFDGLVMLAAANGPWTLDVTMDGLPGAGGLAGPDFTSRGNGAILMEGADVSALPGGVLQEHALRATLATPGWSHFQMETAWRPLAERNVTIRLPGAMPIQEAGAWVSTFATDPPKGIEGGIEDYWDAYGSLQGPAGVAFAYVRAAELAVPVRLSLAHLPDAQLPPGVAPKVYRGTIDRIFWTAVDQA